jgi:hypothetical protein
MSRYRFAAITATVALALAACQPTEATPATVAPTTTTTTTTTSTTTTSTTTTTTTIPTIDAPCPEWHPTAIEAGWDTEHIDRLGYIIWRESRCQPDAFNGTDPNGGSRGLVQINQYWCKQNRYNPAGWLQAQGVLTHCDDLHDPLVNLTAALAIYGYAEGRGCGWSPWTTRNTRWC